MNVTRLYWGGLSTGTLLLSGAVFLEQPLLAGGGAAVLGWLLVRQLLFVREVRRIAQTATVEQVFDRNRIVADEPLSLSVTVSLTRPTSLHLVVDVDPPAAARCASPDAVVTLDPGATEGVGEATMVWDVAGRNRLRPALVTFRDRTGLFVVTARVGTERPVHVGTPRVSQVSVGRTGRELIEGSDNQAIVGLLQTIEPNRVREFVTGDSARHIDWNATARFGDLHVREYEREVDRSVLLVVDTRATMTQGPVGRTKLDYVRHFSLSVCELLGDRQLPVGLYLFDEGGPTTRIQPRIRSEAAGGSVRASLEALGAHTVDGTPASGFYGVGRNHGLRSPRTVVETGRALDDDSAFATQLRPFFEPSRSPSRPTDVGPLYQTIRANMTDSAEQLLTIIFTDDSHGAELVESVTAASFDRGEVIVFLTPSVLFDVDLLADPRAAYRAFLRFEKFRRSLDAYADVTVYELGPGDTLASVLSTAPGARRQRRTRTGKRMTHNGTTDGAGTSPHGTTPQPASRGEAASD